MCKVVPIGMSMRVTSAGGTIWEDEGDISRWYLLG